MAVSSSALTLADYAKMSNDPLVQAVSMSLIRAGNVMQDIPMQTKPTLKANGARYDGSSMPSVSWAPLNSEPTVTKATPSPYSEQVYIIRNAIDVDNLILLDQNQIVDPRASQLNMWLESLTYDFNDKFINNNQLTGDNNCFVGIRERLDSASTWGVRSENKINASATMTTSLTAANANNFFEKLDQLLWSLGAPDGTGCVLYMNDTMYRRLHFAIRQMGTSGGFSTQTDQFDRRIDMYKGAIIRDIGKKSDQTTNIITSTETTAGANGSSTYTSIYGVRYGVDYLSGWQMRSLDTSIRDLGLQDNGVIYRTVVDWAVGLYMAHTRSIARLYNINLG
jgi:hypothetical protein